MPRFRIDVVVIARGNEPLVRLMPITLDASPRVGGQWAGKIVISDDFEFTEKELDELFYRPMDPAAK